MNTFIKVRKSFFSLKRSFTSILLIAIITITLSGCYMLPEDEEVMAPPVVLKDPVVQEITTEKVRRGNIENKVEFWGSFMSPDQTDLFFTDTGMLGSVNVAAGDYVKAGDVLAKLECEDLDLQLAQLEINLQKAELNYNSLMVKNAESGGGFSFEVEDAQLNIDSIELNITNLEEKLSKSSIIAPIDGIVSYIRPTQIGSMIMMRTNFITVSDLKSMVLVVKQDQIKEPLLAGKVVTVNYNGNTYQGEVEKTPEDNVNEENANFTNTYTIHVEDLDISLIKLNDTASVGYVVEKVDNALLIDKSNIRTSDGISYVNVYKDGNIEEREVETGVISDNGVDIEITKGLADTDEIVVP